MITYIRCDTLRESHMIKVYLLKKDQRKKYSGDNKLPIKQFIYVEI